MRARITVAVVVVALGISAAPEAAADQTVHAIGARTDEYGSFPNAFQPSTVRLALGESVSFVNNDGVHNVRFEDGQFEAPAEPSPPEGWPAVAPRRTFADAGTYRFYCELHGAPGGVGMTGVVLVASQTLPGPGGPQAPGATLPLTPGANAQIESLSLTAGRFCARRSRRCRRPGVRLRIRLSQPVHVTGALKRRPLTGRGRARTFGTLDFGSVATGNRLLRFTRTESGRRLTRGRYSLTIRAGHESQVLRFKIV